MMGSYDLPIMTTQRKGLLVMHKSEQNNRGLRQRLVPYILILPACVYIIVILIYPLLYNLVLSFGEMTSFNSPLEFTGIKNYVDLFSSPQFSQTLRQTFVWTIGSVAFQFILGLVAAITVNRSKLGKAIGLSLLLIPWVTSFTVTAIIWRWGFDGQLGIINDVLMRLNLISQPVNWLASPSLAMGAVIVANMWKYFPFNMLLIIGGLQSIPFELNEASMIDGANAWQRFLKISIPLLRPVIFVTIMIDMVHAFNAFTIIHIMTGGGPLRGTEILPILIYRLAFESFSFEKAAAASVILFVTVSIAIFFYSRVLWKETDLS